MSFSYIYFNYLKKNLNSRSLLAIYFKYSSLVYIFLNIKKTTEMIKYYLVYLSVDMKELKIKTLEKFVSKET